MSLFYWEKTPLLCHRHPRFRGQLPPCLQTLLILMRTALPSSPLKGYVFFKNTFQTQNDQLTECVNAQGNVDSSNRRITPDDGVGDGEDRRDGAHRVAEGRPVEEGHAVQEGDRLLSLSSIVTFLLLFSRPFLYTHAHVYAEIKTAMRSQLSSPKSPKSPKSPRGPRSPRSPKSPNAEGSGSDHGPSLKSLRA